MAISEYPEKSNIKKFELSQKITSSNFEEFCIANIEDDLSGEYSYKIDDMYILDLTILKKIWHDKLDFTLGIRNLFNDTQQYHPMGAGFDLNYFVNFRAEI